MKPSPCFLNHRSLLCLALLGSFQVCASAADFYWNGGDGTFDSENWAEPGHPGSNDAAYNNSTGTVTISDWSGKSIYAIDDTSGSVNDVVHFKQTSGTVTLEEFFRLGQGSGTVGVYQITGGTLSLGGSSGLGNGLLGNGIANVGRDGGTGKLIIDGGLVEVRDGGTSSWDGALRVGQGSGAVGYVEQNAGTLRTNRRLILGQDGGTGHYSLGIGSTLTVGTDLWVGGMGANNSSFTMTGGTATVGEWFTVGGASDDNSSNANSSGAATISGGTLTVNGQSAIGQDGGTGTLTLKGDAAINSSKWFVIGRRGGTGTLNIEGGTLTTTGDNLVVGGDTGGSASRGTVNHSAGSLVLAGGGLRIGGDTKTDHNQGIYYLSGSGEIRATANNSWISLGQAGAEGVLTMTGGSILHAGVVTSDPTTTTRISIGDGKKKDGATYTEGTVNQSGGTFTATGVDTDIGRNGGTGVWNLSGTGEATLRTLNLGTHTTESTGTFNLNSGGKLTLSGLNIGYSGSSAFNFNGGTLIASDDMTVAAGGGAINVLASGGTIDNGGHTVAFEQALIGAGNLTLKGSGTFNLSVACALTGTVTVEQGTLLLSAADALDGLSGLSFASGTELALNYDGTASLGFLQVAGVYVAAGEYTLTELQDYLSANGLDGDLTLIDGGQGDYSTISITAVPEPSTYALVGFAGLALLTVLRRRKKA